MHPQEGTGSLHSIAVQVQVHECEYVWHASIPLHLGLGAAAVSEGGAGAGLGGRVEDLRQNGREMPHLRHAGLDLVAQLGLRAELQSLSLCG